jgi:hypothetical protein
MMLRCWIAMLILANLAGAQPPSNFGEFPLPVWNEGERSRLETDGWVAGDRLLTDESNEDTIESTVIEPLDLPLANAGDIGETQVPENPVPEQYWESYFGLRPESFLVDPQELLSPNDERERLEFLKYHAGDSSIDLYVYVFNEDQDIPGEVRDEELMERFFSEGRPAAVLFYYMGAPQRSTLALSPSLTDVVSAAEQRRALESSVMQAFKDEEPARQFEAFLVQMSIRIYWMERMIYGDDGAALVQAFPEAPRIPEKGNSSIASHLAPLKEMAMPYALPAGAVVGALFFGLILISVFRMKRRYLFPEFNVEPRLGAAHAAGVGAVISFSSAAIPPAAQRDQMPDYLRRA